MRVDALVARAGRCARRPRARPPTSASRERARRAGEREDRAVVVGVGVDVEQRAPRPSRTRRRSRRARAASRPSETLGTASRRPAALTAPGARRRAPSSAAELQRRVEHDDVQVDGHRDGAADPGAGAEGDVDRAEDLLVLEHVAGQRGALVGADAELGQVGPELAGGLEQVREEAPSPGPAGRDERPSPTLRRTGRSASPNEPASDATTSARRRRPGR